jgi:hypothetical protein
MVSALVFNSIPDDEQNVKFIRQNSVIAPLMFFIDKIEPF